MAIFTGSAVALVTPFKEDGAVDYEQLKSLVVPDESALKSAS